jgi:hypothetical protein
MTPQQLSSEKERFAASFIDSEELSLTRWNATGWISRRSGPLDFSAEFDYKYW